MIWTWIVSKIINPFKGYIIAAGAAVTAIGYIYLKGRSAGKAAEKARLAKATKKIEEKWDAIDRSDASFDDALNGLRRAADRD